MYILSDPVQIIVTDAAAAVVATIVVKIAQA